MLTNGDTSELVISNRMIGLCELRDTGDGGFSTKHGLQKQQISIPKNNSESTWLD